MRRLQTTACALLLTLAPALHAQAPSPTPPDAPPAAPTGAAPTTEPPATAPPGDAVAPAATSSRAPFTTRARTAAARPVAREPASAVSEAPALELDDGLRVEAEPLPTLSAWLGFGSLWVPSDGLDPFAEDDALLMFSAGAAVSLARAGALDVAAVAGWDVTATDERYRGESTSLGLMRFALGPELRGSILDRLFWHGRLSPTLTRLSVELDESSSDATLSQSRWLWGAEAALGLDFRFAEVRASATDAVGIFLRCEGGYAWSPSTDVSLEAGGSDAPVRTAPLELGELAIAGPSFKASVGAGF